MIPNVVTLAQAGERRAAAAPIIPRVAAASSTTVTVVSAAPVEAPVELPSIPRQPSAAAYFGMFRACGCGHSSAWHGGAFGDAWRAGQQVRGACEALGDASSSTCGCQRFSDPEAGE